MKRYSAKLLFQFRVVVEGDSGKRRFCEDRTILIRALSAKEALALAKRKGRSSQYHYKNSQRNDVYFEFIGVVDLLHLGQECENDEVWYEIQERLLPMERKQDLVPQEQYLRAIQEESPDQELPHAISIGKA